MRPSSQAVLDADKVPAHPFEKTIYFEGCMPIEEMARRGPKTLAFGPMRPVGLTDPRTGRRSAAVVQLRQDDREARLYNIVGFQTKMTYPEQRRVLRMIPGLERAEFVRLGSLHRNTFIDSPRLLNPALNLQTRPDIFVAGQMIGVEGYVESAAAGLLAAINAARVVRGDELIAPPPATASGLAGRIHYRHQPQGFPADEREFRSDARTRWAQPRTGEKNRTGRARTGRDRRLDPTTSARDRSAGNRGGLRD